MTIIPRRWDVIGTLVVGEEPVLTDYEKKVKAHGRKFKQQTVEEFRSDYVHPRRTSYNRTRAVSKVPTKLEKRRSEYVSFQHSTRLDTKPRMRRETGGYRRPGSNK